MRDFKFRSKNITYKNIQFPLMYLKKYNQSEKKNGFL